MDNPQRPFIEMANYLKNSLVGRDFSRDIKDVIYGGFSPSPSREHDWLAIFELAG
jgi:hypothetical protein